MSSSLSLQALSALADVNPPLGTTGLSPASRISFIPMADVSEGGIWTGQAVRLLREVSAGYTPFKDEDVLFAKITPCMENGKGAYVDGLESGVGFGSTEFHVLRAREGNDPKFVFYWTMTPLLRRKAEAFMTGSAGQRRVQAIFFDNFIVPHIALPEQRRIAEILDTIDEAIRKTEEIIAKLQQMKQGLLHDLLTRGLDENGELRDPERHPEQFKNSELGRIPREWELVKVLDAGSVRLGRQRSPKYATGPYLRPYLRVANVFDGYIDYSDVLWMNFSPQEQRTYDLQHGDVLLNEGQSIELVGRSAMYKGNPGAHCFQNTIIRFRAYPTSCEPMFARAVFKRWLDTGRFMTVARQTTSIAHLGADRFAKMEFPLPGLQEQERISKQIQVAEAGVWSERKTLAKIRLLKQGLMDDLLTGRVRVPIPEVATR